METCLECSRIDSEPGEDVQDGVLRLAQDGEFVEPPDLNCKGPDLENMLLARRKDFWRLLDHAHKENEKRGFTELEDVPNCQVYDERVA